MTPHQASAVIAIVIGVALLSILFLSYVAWSYRRRGTIGLGHAVIVVGSLIYFLALWMYAILPLPDPSELVCTGNAMAPQLRPLASFGMVNFATNGLADPMFLQLIANVVLFIPFGLLTRHLFNPREPVWLILAGLGTSLLLETTQLTGVYGAYPCAYRLFDVDDLLTNTAGVAIGVALAPLLRFIPTQSGKVTSAPRTVTVARRLLGMVADVIIVGVVSFLAYLPVAVQVRNSPNSLTFTQIHALVQIAITVVLLLGVPILARGATLGQIITFTRPVTRGGSPPGITSRVVRFVSGAGGYFVVRSLSDFTGQTTLGWVATVWVVISAGAVMLWHPRGVSGVLALTTIGDARDPALVDTQARRVDPRSLGIAVLSAGFIGLLASLMFSEISSVSPAAGLALGLLVAVILSLVTLGLVPYLLVVGIATIRKERLSLSTLLPVFTAFALFALFVALVIGLVTFTAWVFVPAAGLSTLVGYLGAIFAVFLFYGQWYAARSPEGEVHAVVVLGSRIFDDQVPPLLAARVDRGMQVLDEVLTADPDAATVLVCSGGKGSDEIMPEGEAMAAYALAHGALAERVLVEPQSRNTEENLAFTRQLLTSKDLGTRMVVVTNDYHAFRTGIIAREAGIDAQVVGAPTARYYFPAAIIREYVGVLARRPVLHGIVAVLFAAFGAGIAVLIA